MFHGLVIPERRCIIRVYSFRLGKQAALSVMQRAVHNIHIMCACGRALTELMLRSCEMQAAEAGQAGREAGLSYTHQ